MPVFGTWTQQYKTDTLFRVVVSKNNVTYGRVEALLVSFDLHLYEAPTPVSRHENMSNHRLGCTTSITQLACHTDWGCVHSLEVLCACVDGHAAECCLDALDCIGGQLRRAVAHHHCCRTLHTCSQGNRQHNHKRQHKRPPWIDQCTQTALSSPCRPLAAAA